MNNKWTSLLIGLGCVALGAVFILAVQHFLGEKIAEIVLVFGVGMFLLWGSFEPIEK